MSNLQEYHFIYSDCFFLLSNRDEGFESDKLSLKLKTVPLSKSYSFNLLRLISFVKSTGIVVKHQTVSLIENTDNY